MTPPLYELVAQSQLSAVEISTALHAQQNLLSTADLQKFFPDSEYILNRKRRMLEDIIEQYSRVFGTKSKQKNKQPVIFLPNPASKPCVPVPPKMSSFGYLAFVLSIVNAAVNTANNVNNNQNNNNNNENNNNNNNVNVANSNNNVNNDNAVAVGKKRNLDLDNMREMLAKHYTKSKLARPNSENRSEVSLGDMRVGLPLMPRKQMPKKDQKESFSLGNVISSIQNTTSQLGSVATKSLQKLFPIRNRRQVTSNCPNTSQDNPVSDESTLASILFLDFLYNNENAINSHSICKLVHSASGLGAWAKLTARPLAEGLTRWLSTLNYGFEKEELERLRMGMNRGLSGERCTDYM